MKNLKVKLIAGFLILAIVALIVAVTNESVQAQLPQYLVVFKGADKASVAGTMNFSRGGGYFVVTGVLKTDSIVGANIGAMLILQSASTDTLVDGKNLKLSGNFNATADDVIALIYDGTYWVELHRSVN